MKRTSRLPRPFLTTAPVPPGTRIRGRSSARRTVANSRIVYTSFGWLLLFPADPGHNALFALVKLGRKIHSDLGDPVHFNRYPTLKMFDWLKGVFQQPSDPQGDIVAESEPTTS